MPGPWAVFQLFPLIGSAKTVRLSVITLLLVGLLIAWALSRMRFPIRVVAAGVVVAAFLPLYPFAPYTATLVSPTPRFFTTSAVNAIPARAITLVLPVAGFPQVQAMTWQIEAHIRFDMVGGYSVFKYGDRSTFFPPLPAARGVLATVSRTGVLASPVQLAVARASIRQYRIQYIVVTHAMENFDLVSNTVASIGKCVVRQVSDVGLCRVGG